MDWFKTGGCLVLLSLPAMAVSARAEEEVTVLPTVEVTARADAGSGVAQEAATTAVSVVTAEEIEARQIRRLEDALRLVPGVTLSGQRGLGLPGSVTIRGLGPRNVRVFIDGVEVSDTSQAQSQYAISELNMADVERIEVLRGPQPGRFGADAGGGVINITTRRPTRPFGANAYVEGGSYGTLRGNASVSGLAGAFDYKLTATATTIDGYSDFNEDRGGVEDDPFRQYSVGGAFGYQVTDDLRLDVSGNYMREDVFYDSSSADNDWNRDESETRLHAGIAHTAFDGRLQQSLGVGYAVNTRQYWGAGTAGDTYDGYKTAIDYRALFAATERLNLDIGADAERERIEQNTPGFAPLTPVMEDEFWNYGAYVTAGFTPIDKLDLTATARFDDHEDFGDEVTWRIGASYELPTATRLHASYGTARQTPSLYERFDPCYGNAALQPEKSEGWDAGVEQAFLGGDMMVGATYFQQETEDQINWAYSPPVSALCYGGGYVNIDRTRSRGGEVELVVRPLATVDLRASYTRQTVTNLGTGLRLKDWPRNQANVSLGWQASAETRVDLGVDYRDSIDRYGKGQAYWLVNLDGRHALTDTMTVFARVENLFDQDYEATWGYGTPGISGYLGLGLGF
ncbi:TonB-dependent receptor [Zavarzinia compransoris]|uniref:TonB-dependent receptor plug domain-containing protein n=1 Tax=Zavarzinia marina TaxID=2911065 RepID=UPI001F2EE498|nr:TonB-dependent receptor [Zavarzinia marina]MCF4167397.1 TonB-dependent receptor [Zavarzinia marina]